MAKGGASHPVHVVSASDLKQNGGNFRLRGGSAVKIIGNTDTENIAQGKLQAVYVVPDGFPVQGGEPLPVTNAIDVSDRGLRGGLIATPVYVVNGDEWPITYYIIEITFQTNKNGTFAPSVTMSSGTATWIIDGTEYNTNSPSVALAGSTVDVSLIVDPTRCTAINMSSQSILSIPSNILSLSAIENLQLHSNTSMTGDASNLSALTTLTYLRLTPSAITVNIDSYDALVGLTYLNINNRGGDATGNIAVLNSMPVLEQAWMYNCDWSGDLSTVTISSIQQIYLYSNSNMSYGSGAGAGNWTNATAIGVHSCAWSQAEVSRFIGDIYASRDSWVGGAKTLSIGGTNAAPDATALTQISTLQASYSWTITYTAP